MTTLIISGAEDLTAAMTVSGTPITFNVGGTPVPLTPGLMGAIWALGYKIPKTDEEFTEVFTQLHVSGALDKLGAKVVGADRLRTLSGKSDSGYYEAHVKLIGWSKVADGKVYGAVFEFNLALIAPELFPPIPSARGDVRKMKYSLPPSAVLSVGSNLTQAGYDVIKKFDDEANAHPKVKLVNGKWDIYAEKGMRDSEGNAFMLPSLGIHKESLLILNVVKKPRKDGSGHYYGSEAVDMGNGKRRAGVTPVNGVFYINHVAYKGTRDWNVTVGK